MSVKHKIQINAAGDTDVVELNMGKAIRRKCLDCSGFSSSEVNICTVKLCPLFPFRFGKDPGRITRKMTDEERVAAAERLKKAREKWKDESKGQA